MEKNNEGLRHKVKAVIFDLDGTLVDSEPNYSKADDVLLEEYGIQALSEEIKKKYVGIGTREMMEDIKGMYGLKESIDVLVAKKNKYYLDIAKENTIVFPEMYRFLQFLKENNYPLAIASGSSPEIIDIILTITNLTEYFDVILSADEVVKGKPAPDVFWEAAKRLGVPFESCLVMEDSVHGVEAAKSASMYCMALPYMMEEPFNDSFLMADVLFKQGIIGFRAEEAMDWLRKNS
ncbi:HAD family hydrolase [Pelosinus propionicus]|uniref:Haloacid dehalogenase superfamily, subfamily IA, variant 3 with third motif having DD or ED/haloacid dehalogenase superfamily, subfamily IA, variant 1 with third motif having Dx(3-4)D or Dx(3-4)E n=1 Tax=Pelosinus propionicus DSM 13327 TaxID=1123291 RepID=A0A1I4LDL9_9FIRM|nr:HAD family phosphatase [Pelosinus propionicus]SFL88989.1 haloacid dehalogenase superfamily, subfamily IA, variant 3 with third motif having DD or ED/haloacid dehalogenase superfamily, subfamily IA, variant 1 with third motif having Dx(3-4)D or Dx(3-4)E [Pelosinus propionicus DSM 13327]